MRKSVKIAIISATISGFLLSSPVISEAARPTRSVMTAASYEDAVLYNNTFIAANRWGVEVFEINDSGLLRSLSKYHTSGRAEFLDAAGDIAAVSNLDGSVELFHITGKTLTRSGWIDPGFHPTAVKLSGDYLYIGGLEQALAVYDISEPEYPVRVYDLDFNGYPHEFVIRGDTLFAASYHGGVALLDISDPAAPFLLEQYFLPDFVYGLALDGPLVYACAHRSGLYVLDLRSDGEPPVIGHLEGFGSARKAMITDEGLLTLDGFGAMKLIDISSPSRPEEIWSVDLDFNAMDFAVKDDFLFLANWNYGAKLYDLELKEGMEKINEIVNYSECKSIDIKDDIIYAGGGTGGMLVFDNELNRIPIPNYTADGNCLEVNIEGDLAFLSSDENGLSIMNISDPYGIKEISALEIGGWAKSTAFDGRDLYLANWQGIVTVDIEDINNPARRSFFDTDFGSSKLITRNDTLFVAGSGGLELYDISDPSNIAFISGYRTDDPASGLTLFDNNVIMALGWGGVEIITISDNLLPVSHIDRSESGKAVASAVKGRYMYVAEVDAGISVWDISDITRPEYEMTMLSTGRAYDLAIAGNRMYAADYYGLTIYDLPSEDRDPGNDDDHSETQPSSVNLYPNPVAGKATLSFYVAAAGQVNVELYDILGRRVSNLFNGYLAGGQNSLEWSGRDLSSGYYFMRIVGNGFSESKPLAIIR